MAELDPLRFAVEIENRATKQLQDAKSELLKILDKPLNVQLGVEQKGNFINIVKEETAALKEEAREVENVKKARKQVEEEVSKVRLLTGKQDWTGALSINNVIDYTKARLKELGLAINKTMEIQSKAPNGANIKAIEEMTSEYRALQSQLDSLYVAFEKLISVEPVDMSKKLGLEHLKGYVGPAQAATDAQWTRMKKEAEIYETAREASEKHRQKLEELTAAFAKHDAQLAATEAQSARARSRQEAENRERQKAVAVLRRQSEELVKVRMNMLRSQATSLRQLLSNGKEGLGEERYNAVRDALRSVREEMSQIEIIMQRMGSYSTKDLFAAGRGTGMNYQPLISDSRTLLATKNAITQEELQFAAALKNTTAEAKRQSNVMSDLKSLATQYLGVWGAQGFLRNIIQVGGQLESQRLSLTAILGQASYANELYSKVQALAVKSPFGVVQLDQYSKNLSAYGYEYNELFDMTKRLADIAAGTGTDFGRLALALGHVRSEMALTGYTLRQFSMANVPMLRMLSQNLGVTATEIRKMVRAKEVSYKDVEQVIRELTNEGGMFYNMQETMSEAVSAKFKNLKDSMDIMYGQMAESGIGTLLKSIAAALMQITKHWQSAAAAIGTAATMIAIYKTAQMAVNAGMKAQTSLILGNKVSTEALTAEQVKSLAVKKLITRQELLEAVATGKLTAEQALLAASYFEVNAAEVERIASMGKTGLAMEGLKAKTAGLVAALTNPWTLSLIAISSVVAAITEYRTWIKGMTDDAQSYLDKQKSGAQEIADYLKHADKPTNERELVGLNEEMKSILKNAGLYTDEIEEQVRLAKTLSEEYDVLLNAMKSFQTLSSVGITAKDIADVVKSTGTDKNVREWIYAITGGLGLGIYNIFSNGGDTMAQNADDLDKYQKKVQKAITSLGRNDLQDAVNSLVESGVHTEMANQPLEEQLRILAEDGKAWKMFAAAADDGSKKFKKNIKSLREDLIDASKEWGRIANDDIKNIIDKMIDVLGVGDREGLLKFKNENPQIFQDFVNAIISSIEDKHPEIADRLRTALLDAVNGDFVGQFAQKIGQAIDEGTGSNANYDEKVGEAMRKIGQKGRSAVKSLGKYGVDALWLSKYIDISKEPEDIESGLIKEIKKKKEKISSGQKLGLDVSEDEDELRRLNLVKDYYKFSEKSKSSSDANAKALRERVRILKEAESSYQYWRKQVGDEGARSHVNDEFGQILDELGYSFDNIDKFRETLSNLRTEYEKKPKSKEMLEALKELDKVFADIDRKDFEKSTDKMLSSMRKLLDDLTRAWEVYDNVLEATGNKKLAEQMSGFQGETIAGAKRGSLLDFAGVDIDFNEVLSKSDEEIDRYVEGLGLAEDKIKAVQDGLKDWKKEQQELDKGDIISYAKWLGSLVDLESVRRKNQEEYNATLRETNRLEELYKNTNGAQGLSPEEASRRRNAAGVQMERKNWQATSAYYNLYNNAYGMALKEFLAAYEAELELLNRELEVGTITQEAYAGSIEKLNKILSEFNEGGLFGVQGGMGAFLKGGTAELARYYRNRATIQRMSGKYDEAAEDEKLAKALEKAQKAGDDLSKVFERLSSVADLLANMFSSLGMDDAANAFGDAAHILGGIENGAQTLSFLGTPGMIAGAAIGGVTAIAQVHDERLERQIARLEDEVSSIEANTELIKTFRGRQLGYDSGIYKWRFGAATSKGGGALNEGYEGNDNAKLSMYGYYIKNSEGTGYEQEYWNLLEERKKKIEELEKTESKSSSESKKQAEELQKEIADLDQQLYYFSEDLAKELWGIDFKGWSDQLGDALMTAFENGENAMQAFDATVKEIMQSVVKEMLTIGVIEPIMKRAQEQLFGKLDENGNRTGGLLDLEEMRNDPKGFSQKLAIYISEILNKDVKPAVVAAQEAFVSISDALEQGGLTGGLYNTDSFSTLSSSVQGMREETADLLAGYVNALRQDVAADRIVLNQFVSDMWPQYVEQVTGVVSSLSNIDQNVANINILLSENGSLYMLIADMKSHFDNITNGVERVYI